jgi:hypothetical protein
MAHWTRGDERDRKVQEWLRRRMPPMRDDFVTVPLPRVADANLNSPQVAAALKAYQREAKVLDTRLLRKVTLQMKGASLEEFCETLGTRTGVDLRIARDVADEKVTLFVTEQPARDVMRAVARLFGFSWLRSRRDGAYRYELAQDLRSRLAEEEARSRDQSEALMALDAEMARYRPYLNLTTEQLDERIRRDWERMRRVGATRVSLDWNVPVYAWGPLQLYQRLTAADRAALVGGQEIVFRADSKDPSRLLPSEMGRSILQRDEAFAGKPEAKITQVRMRINRLDGGRMVLGSRQCVTFKHGPERYDAWSMRDWSLATGRSSAILRPENARANAAVRNQPLFLRTVSLRPEVVCPKLKAQKQGKQEAPRLSVGEVPEQETPHVTTAEFWEAVHRETGANIVADFYSRPYNADQATVANASLFDALCKVGDRLGIRWKKDGEFLLGRSTSYFWDKLREVPKRHLVRWQREKQGKGYLPIESLMEMAALTEEQLDSQDNGEAITHCWGLEEWLTVGPHRRYEMGYGQVFAYRRRLRFLATLTPEQRRRAFEPDGIGPEELTPAQRKAFWDIHEEGERIRVLQGEEAGGIDPAFLATAHYVAEYLPAGWYVWTPPESTQEKPWPRSLYRIVRRTAEEALAEARRIYPEATMEQVRRMKVGEFRAGLQLSSARMRKG